MKQSNLKVGITGLTISVCLIMGSAIATAKEGNWHAEPLQNQEQDFFVMDTKFRIDLARQIKIKEQNSSHLLSARSVQTKSLDEKAITDTPKLTAKKPQPKLAQPKAVVPSKSSKKVETTQKRVTSKKQE